MKRGIYYFKGFLGLSPCRLTYYCLMPSHTASCVAPVIHLGDIFWKRILARSSWAVQDLSKFNAPGRVKRADLSLPPRP